MTRSMTPAEKLKILSDGTRLRIMECLLPGPKRVGELARLLRVEQSLLSHHLRALRQAGLVVAVREGRSITYRPAPGTQSRTNSQAIDLGSYRVLFNNPEGGAGDVHDEEIKRD